MPSFRAEPEAVGGRRQMVLAAVVLALAVATGQVSQSVQERIAFTLRASVLRPFIATQEIMTEARVRAGQVGVLMERLDSLTEILATQAALFDENRTLRDLLGLAERAGPEYLPATVLRPGTEGSESIFLIDLGLEDGVRDGSAVVSARGLVGVIREARARSSVGMDWSHPDFRASAMLADGSVYGIVENHRAEFREGDRLLLNGAAYHAEVRPGSLVITSGLGVLPRGIPIGRIDTIADEQGTWLKSYWLRPMVVPGAATHVLVVTVEGEDVSPAWPEPLLVEAEPADDSAAVSADDAPRLAGVEPDAGAPARRTVPAADAGGVARPSAPAGAPSGASTSRPETSAPAASEQAGPAREPAGASTARAAVSDGSGGAVGTANGSAGADGSDGRGGVTAGPDGPARPEASSGAAGDGASDGPGAALDELPIVVPPPGPPPAAVRDAVAGAGPGGSTRGGAAARDSARDDASGGGALRGRALAGDSSTARDSSAATDSTAAARDSSAASDSAAARPDSAAAADSAAARDTLSLGTGGGPRRDTTSFREGAARPETRRNPAFLASSGRAPGSGGAGEPKAALRRRPRYAREPSG